MNSTFTQERDDAEERKKTKNKVKNLKKKNKEESRKKALEEEAARAKKVSSSISLSPLEHNKNHSCFHEVDSIENQAEENNVEEEIAVDSSVGDTEVNQEDDEHDEEYVLVTNNLECVSIGNSPSTVLDDLPLPPPLELGEAELIIKENVVSKKHKNKESKRFQHFSPSDPSDNKLSKKQAKEAAKAKYAVFEARVLPGLVAENPRLKLRDHRARAVELWTRSPENPDHPNHALFLAHQERNDVE
jgi:hypothetical protein